MKIHNGVVFATVGTTKFDLFVSTLTDESTLKALKLKGYNNLIIQIGNGTTMPNSENCEKLNMKLEFYKFKNSIHSDISKADLVISHAGAGTCLEVLQEKKPLLVVVNETLMHNHQTELADQLSSDGYIFATTCGNLVETINKMNINELKTFPPAQPNLLSNFLNNFMGFEEKDKKDKPI